MKRREFLTATAAAATTLAIAPPIRAANPTRRLRAGFLGGAHSHASAKWRLVRESPDYTLIGLAEESATVRAEYATQGAKFLPPDELLTACEVVFVESAVADHARHALMALRAGKHVHVEKPPADNLRDVEEMARLAREKQLVLQVGYMWRYHPGFAAIFELVRQGWLGQVYLVRGMIGNQLGSERRPEWAAFAGGGLFELGSHLVDALVRLLGEPRAATPFLRKHGDFADDLKDNNVVVFEFPKATGLILNATLQPNAGPQRVFEVFGTNGRATLRPIEPPALEIELAQAAGPYPAGLNRVPMPTYDRYVADLAELAAVVRGDRRLSVTPDEELRVQRWLLRASGMG
ncbi:MAG TPA: Gfo/Idh/MocA family oxidoreductase [Candidatus Paceibacterota bacterium]|nr:Gfo/Idh/MocA family oxidoreductase [Verrucomicrobiota bacterium]HRY48547.1 Gfo/Idh/MocA family oxidoreductase [Candidatus Paceibacterota bacterium]